MADYHGQRRRQKEERLPIVRELSALGFSRNDIAGAIGITMSTVVNDLRGHSEENAYVVHSRRRKDIFSKGFKRYAELYGADHKSLHEEKLLKALRKLFHIDAFTMFFLGMVAAMTQLAIPHHSQRQKGYVDLLNCVFGFPMCAKEDALKDYFCAVASGKIPPPASRFHAERDCAAYYLNAARREHIAPVWPEEEVVEFAFERVLKTLTPREEEVIHRRFGINREKETLARVANYLGITKERVRQIEAKALRKLRHPSRSEHLERFFGLSVDWKDERRLFFQKEEEELVSTETPCQTFARKLCTDIHKLKWSVRAENCLKQNHIQTIGDLVQCSEGALLRMKYFGRKSLNEIKAVLAERGLALGMSIDEEVKKAFHSTAQSR